MADNNDIFDNRFYIAPMGAVALAPDSRNSDNGYGGGFAIGKSVLPHVGIEIDGDYLYYGGKQVTTPGQGLICGLLSLCPDQTSQAPDKRVYGAGPGGNLYLSPSNYGLFAHADVQGGNRLVYNGGLGYDLPFMHQGFALRVEALYHKEADFTGEPLFHLGVRIPLGALPAPAAPPPEPPPQVVPVEAPPPPPPPPTPPPCQPPAPGQPISLEGCKTGDTIVLHGVNFEFNKATLTVNAKTLLDQVADALLARKDIKVEIDGHTDGKGSAPYNLKLSDKRAASVKQYLVGRGIDADRMSSKGFGKTMPIADNNTDEGRELNRRVELKVTESQPDNSSAPAPAPANPAPVTPAETPSPESAPAPAPDSNSSAPAPGDSGSPSTPAPAQSESGSAPAPAPAPAQSDLGDILGQPSDKPASSAAPTQGSSSGGSDSSAPSPPQ